MKPATGDFLQIKWIESVLYKPDGSRDTNPFYTFTYDPSVGLPSLPGVSSTSSGGTVYPGQEYFPDDSGIDRNYPPVEPYEDVSQYVGTKYTEGFYNGVTTVFGLLKGD